MREICAKLICTIFNALLNREFNDLKRNAEFLMLESAINSPTSPKIYGRIASFYYDIAISSVTRVFLQRRRGQLHKEVADSLADAGGRERAKKSARQIDRDRDPRPRETVGTGGT